MEITIIHGQGHEGSTYHVTAMLKEKLAKEGDEAHEYFLPADGPEFCVGCFGCMFKGESIACRPIKCADWPIPSFAPGL